MVSMSHGNVTPDIIVHPAHSTSPGNKTVNPERNQSPGVSPEYKDRKLILIEMFLPVVAPLAVGEHHHLALLVIGSVREKDPVLGIVVPLGGLAVFLDIPHEDLAHHALGLAVVAPVILGPVSYDDTFTGLGYEDLSDPVSRNLHHPVGAGVVCLQYGEFLCAYRLVNPAALSFKFVQGIELYGHFL